MPNTDVNRVQNISRSDHRRSMSAVGVNNIVLAVVTGSPEYVKTRCKTGPEAEEEHYVRGPKPING